MVIVVEAFRSWYSAPGGAVALPRPGDESIGLHCVHLIHYRDLGDTLGFANSWGRGWGARGYGTIPFEYLDRYFYESFVTRRARFGPPAWRFATTPDPMPPREFRRRLLIESPRQRVRQRRAKGENWVMEIYETPSPTTGWPVLCVGRVERVRSTNGLGVSSVPTGGETPNPRDTGVVRLAYVPKDGYR
jgi:hypothetical protein